MLPCYSQVKKQFDGCFLLKIKDKIVYYNYNDEELDESTPVSLFLFDIKTGEKETLLSDCIYWNCIKINDFVISYTDGKTIFTYDISQKKKKEVYSNQDENVDIMCIVSNEEIIYLFEVNHLNDTCTFKQISPAKNEIIFTMVFSPYESVAVTSYALESKIVFQLQNLIYVYDVAEKQLMLITSHGTGFSISNNSVIYSYFYFPENDLPRIQLREYDLFSTKEKEITNFSFHLFYHTLFSLLADGKYQTYYKYGNELYLFSNLQWTKKDVNLFLIYQDEEIDVFLGNGFSFTIHCKWQ